MGFEYLTNIPLEKARADYLNSSAIRPEKSKRKSHITNASNRMISTAVPNAVPKK